MGVDTSRFYKGLKIEYEGNIWEIVEFSSSKMGRMGAIVTTKLKKHSKRCCAGKKIQVR